MKQLLLIMMFAAGSVFASDDYGVSGASEGMAQEVTRSQASKMGLNKAAFYMVYNTQDMARLDEQIANRLKQRLAAYYSVVYFVPDRDDDHYQAIVTEYVSDVE